jgi:hypothetical protein
MNVFVNIALIQKNIYQLILNLIKIITLLMIILNIMTCIHIYTHIVEAVKNAYGTTIKYVVYTQEEII